LPLSPLGRLKPDQRVRIELRTRELVEGRLEGSHGDTLVVGSLEGPRLVPLSTIQRLWVRGRSTWRFGKGGAIVGGTLGALVSFWATGASDAMTGDSMNGAEAIVSFVAGGVIGGLYVGLPGAIIGRTVPRWDLRYRAADPPLETSSIGGRPSLR
jgi:hypothetical protein